MNTALESDPTTTLSRAKSSYLAHSNRSFFKYPLDSFSRRSNRYPSSPSLCTRVQPSSSRGLSRPILPQIGTFGSGASRKLLDVDDKDSFAPGNGISDDNSELVEVFMKRGVVLLAMLCGFCVLGSKRVLAAEGLVDAGYGVMGQLRNAWPKASMVLRVVKEQGIILALLLGLSAFFSMAETSITTLWPWKVRELAEKEPENGVFRLLRNDVTRFLTTILIGTTVVNIGATALVTDAATAIFGEAGVSAATGVMTVAILLLTEITPKSIAVHNPTEVARFVQVICH